jgi:hypothetical protein
VGKAGTDLNDKAHSLGDFLVSYKESRYELLIAGAGSSALSVLLFMLAFQGFPPHLHRIPAVTGWILASCGVAAIVIGLWAIIAWLKNTSMMVDFYTGGVVHATTVNNVIVDLRSCRGIA